MAMSSRLTATILILFCNNFIHVRGNNQNYKDALAKSIIFFQGQRSGRLPRQQITWRADSGLSDGRQAGVNLTGGYYDAGDNVKFNFPMAFATTMLSWGAVEYGKKLGPLLENTRDAIRWGTDYLLKCSLATPGKLYVGVGNPSGDHQCWERPEDMDTDRSVYSVSAANPGSDVAGETAAALAAASIVFRKVDPNYSKLLLRTAKNVMQFAMDHRGSYSDSLGSFVCPYYCSYSGYKDELLWGAAWLFRATNDVNKYMNFIESLGANDGTDIFSWDDKHAGAYVLLSRRSLVDKDPSFESFRQRADDFMCRILPNSFSRSSSTRYTPGGLMYKMDGSNLQYVTSITFLITTYAKYMAASKHTFSCGGSPITSNILRGMVGYGMSYPKRIHHRGSSLPSYNVRPQSFGCDGGKPYLYTPDFNPNTLTGAIVGGPNQNDFFADQRTDYSRSEPATYINAAIVGALAYFSQKFGAKLIV